MMVEIQPELFEQIERYLEQRAMQQDGEAVRLLQALESAEIERTTQMYELEQNHLIGQPSYGEEN
jgi:aromatic ring hydroxylase